MGGETATRLLSDLLIRGLTVSRVSKTKIGALPRVVFIFTFEDDLGFERHQTVPRKEGEPFLGKIGTLISTDFMVKVRSYFVRD